jgi:hypothetical protein
VWITLGFFFERGTLGVELLSIRHACFLSIRFRSERNGTERTWFRERGGICFAQLAKPNLLQLNWAKNAWRVRIGYSFRSYGAVVRELGGTSKLFRFTPLSRARAGFALTCVAVVHQRSKVRKKFSWVQNPVRFNSWFLLGMTGTLQNFYMGLTHAQNFGDLFHKDENKFGRLSMYGPRSRKPM